MPFENLGVPSEVVRESVRFDIDGCVDEDGNPIVWTYIVDKDLPPVHNLDKNARLF